MTVPTHRAASGDQPPAESKKERAIRLPGQWEQFRPAGPHGEDRPVRRRDDEAHAHGLPGVRRHSLTVVFRAR